MELLLKAGFTRQSQNLFEETGMPIIAPLSESERKERLCDIKSQIQTACPDLKVTEITEHFLGAFVVKIELRNPISLGFIVTEDSERIHQTLS